MRTFMVALVPFVLVCLWGLFVFVFDGFVCRYPGHPQVPEIDYLHNAMSAYKEKTSQYPPSLSDANVRDRKIRFMRHVQVAYSNSNYGTTATDFDTLRDNLREAGKLGTNSQPYTYRDANGAVQLLDLNTLDQAEALVFWLGGFPTPCNANGIPVAQYRTYGFNLDKDNPLRRDSIAAESTDPMRFRTIAQMEFKQDRFADNDDDGWLEYLPQPYKEGTLAAPFVYFDAPTYVASTTPEGKPFDITNLLGYPRQGDPGAANLAAAWGLAVPFAEQYDVTGAKPMRWRNPQSFQIIHPGKDGMYSTGETGDLEQAMRFSVFPSGETYSKVDNFKSVKSYSDEELDNLNNVSKATVDEARRQSGS